jgi:hypothetical protein
MIDFDQRRIDSATARAENAEAERDKAVAALEKLRSDVHWTMGRLKISDLFGHSKNDAPAAEHGYELPNSPQDDTARIEHINRFGRVGLCQGGLMIVVPWSPTGDEVVPDIYNIRHWLDLIRDEMKEEVEL